MSETLLQRYEQDKQMIKKPNENTSYVMGILFSIQFACNKLEAPSPNKYRIILFPGGSYAQIESEWKEIIKAKMSKNKGKTSYVCFFFVIEKKKWYARNVYSKKKTTTTTRTLYIHETEIIYKCGFMIIKKNYISREQ